MNCDILIIQRFFYNFREGFFDFLRDRKVNFRLINSIRSRGRVTVHSTAGNKPYYLKTPIMGIGKNYILFPFLFLHLLKIRPKWIISEGGQNTVNNLQVLFFCMLTRKKYIIWDLGKGYDTFPDTFLRKIYLVIYKMTLRNAAYIYTYNSLGLEYFRNLGMNPDKIMVLNNTVDTRKIKQIREHARSYDQDFIAKIGENQICLVFVGALLPSKNIEDLKILMDKLGSGYTLIIVGDGEASYRSNLFRLFEGTKTIFVGYKKIDEIVPYYQIASFAVLPGLGGLSINQAMAFGLPVICRSADGAEKDLVIENRTGYIYSDLEEASNYIKSKSLQDWKEMGHQAEELLFSEHSIDKMTDKFLSAFNLSSDKIN